ncbi:Na+/H+ antiporter subunit G [Roseivivax sp.]
MSQLLEFAAALALIIGALFTLVGSYGLLKLDDPMKRLHAPTKAGTLGIGSLIMASILHSFATGGNSVHEVLVMAFLFVTAPISAHFVSKVHLHRGTCAEPPAPEPGRDWATRARPEEIGGANSTDA